MSLQDLYYLINIVSHVLSSALVIFIFFITLSLLSEVRAVLQSVRLSAQVAQEKSILSLPPLNTSLFVLNFVKNFLSKKFK